MKTFEMRPKVCICGNFAEFAREFNIGPDDLIVTNSYILTPSHQRFLNGAHVLLQEQYGSGEPSDVMVESILAGMPGHCRRVIGIGGGTVIDIAKLLAIKGQPSLTALMLKTAVPQRDKDLVLVPTTCGTGSEATNISILEFTREGTKAGISDNALFADFSVLIPELLDTLPYSVFATSSIDALIHGMESCVSPRANEYSLLMGYRAMEIIIKGYQKIKHSGKDAFHSITEEFLVASNMAGIAFANAGVGAVHAMSYPLSGKYHVPHGEANYALFGTIFKCYHEISADGPMARLSGFLGEMLHCSADTVFSRLDDLLSHILIKKPLREYGMLETDIPAFTANVMEKQGRLTRNNFVPLDALQVSDIYSQLI